MAERSDYQRFQEALPFYVNGTLPSVEREWLEAYLERHPAAAQDHAFTEAIATALAQRQSSTPYAARWARMQQVLNQSPPPQTLLQRLQAWWLSGIQVPVPALALLLLLAVVPTLYVAQQRLQPETEIMRGETPSDCAKVPRLRVIFKPDAKQADMVQLLRRTETSVLAGPSETGEIWLGMANANTATLAEAARALSNSGLVDDAIVLPPPHEACRP